MSHLTPDQTANLEADIRVRWELQRTMAEHSKPVLSAELGIDSVTLWHIETGATSSRPNTRITAATAKQVRDRRTIWRLANERMQEYTRPALAKKYGVSRTTIDRHIRELREASQSWRSAA